MFVSGVLFLILSLIGLRELIFNAVSPSLKNGIAAGIGLFIAFIGLQQAGVIVKDPGTAVKLNAHFASPDLIVFFVGMLTTAVLHARRNLETVHSRHFGVEQHDIVSSAVVDGMGQPL